jgi:hypothetical protein
MNEFKKCTFCGHRWQSRKDFLEDASTELIGYQVNFDNLRLGFFLFNHLNCRTTFAIPAGAFKDLYNGPVYSERRKPTGTLPGKMRMCLRQRNNTDGQQLAKKCLSS